MHQEEDRQVILNREETGLAQLEIHRVAIEVTLLHLQVEIQVRQEVALAKQGSRRYITTLQLVS
ncbi:hypothetical protein RC91_04635 [Pectobacterium brasiliense]|nr:hypothetical protein NC16_11610 [Pectobacterium brasiliense]KHT08496.1 hypothetical protein RC91_04635 [Pectobacterium brasiliense]